MDENKKELENMREDYSRNPENLDIASKLAQYYIDLGWFNEGIEIYKNLCNIYPDNFALLLAYGNACFSKQNKKEALKAFKKLTILKPKRVEGWNNMGIVQFESEDYEAARQSFNKVLELEPDNHGAILNLGNYYDYKGNIEKAVQMFKHATAVRPDFTDAWFNLGNVYLKIDEYQNAITVYEKSLKYRPKFPSAFKNMGFAYERLENYQKAEIYYKKALEFNKTDASLYVNIANVYTKQKQYDKAKDFYLRSVKIAPKDAAGWLGLRDLSLKKGDITSYVKSTLAILHRLNNEKIAESMKILRKLKQFKHIESILEIADKIGKSGDELDAERMLQYCQKEQTVRKARLIYKRLKNITKPSDQILYCCAEYCVETESYNEAVQHIQRMGEKDIATMEIMWKALIGKKELYNAESLITKYLEDNQDCFCGWYQLARIKVMTDREKEAKDDLKRALQTGFTDIELIDNEKELKKIYLFLSNNK